MIINRQWSMPSKNTFKIKPINELIDRTFKNYIEQYIPWYSDANELHKNAIKLTKFIDPFANNMKYKYNVITNDLDNQYDTDYNLDALDFLKTFPDNYIDIVLFDPPYSPRQVSECYKKLDKTVNMQTTQSSYWSNLKKEISRIVRPGGKVISCAWNSGGIGKTLGFEIEEILLVPHGGWHNDTIVTVERKVKNEQIQEENERKTEK